MTQPDELTEFVDQIHAALGAFCKGDPQPAKALFSHEEDVSLANPFGPPALGWSAVSETMDAAAAHYRDGRAADFERVAGYATEYLAYIIEIERYQAKVGGAAELSAVALRATTIFRREGRAWKIVHRHADPITTIRSAGSVIANSG